MPRPFIVLEGTDGSGKTSLRKQLFQRLRADGQDVLSIVPLSWRDVDASRIIVEAKYQNREHPRHAITAAYVRDKELLCEKLIVPHVQERVVVADRYVASDLVYHHLLWQTPLRDTYDAYRASRVRPPDLTFFLDTPPDVAFERARARGSGGINRWDYLDRQQRLYDLFRTVLTGNAFPWLGPVEIIDNRGAFADTAAQLVARVQALVGAPSAS